jgi:DNA gyrase/topoisomerase IV subunit B
MSRRRLEFEPGEAGVEAAKLKKFSDGDGSQIEWLPDAGRFTLLGQVQYSFLSAEIERLALLQ